MKNIKFAKMTGAGNDFMVIDNRENQLPDPKPDWIARVCARRLSVGADGLMLLSAAGTTDFTMQYFNADGSVAAMCGNGGRCIARFAVLLGICREGQDIRFQAPSGKYLARVIGDQVRLSLPSPQKIKPDVALSLADGERQADFMEMGVPHTVFFSTQVEAEPVLLLGREVRQHQAFAPEGTNVNFAQVLDEHHLRLRTYERGVEDETLACGTGAAAAVLLAAKRGSVKSPVSVETRSRAVLSLTFAQQGEDFTDITQTGEARLVYWGELSTEATGFNPPDDARA